MVTLVTVVCTADATDPYRRFRPTNAVNRRPNETSVGRAHSSLDVAVERAERPVRSNGHRRISCIGTRSRRPGYSRGKATERSATDQTGTRQTGRTSRKITLVFISTDIPYRAVQSRDSEESVSRSTMSNGR